MLFCRIYSSVISSVEKRGGGDQVIFLIFNSIWNFVKHLIYLLAITWTGVGEFYPILSHAYRLSPYRNE